MFGIFRNKRKVEVLQEEVRTSFDHVKKDFGKIGEWIKYLDGKGKSNEKRLELMETKILEISSDISEIKDLISFFGPQVSGRASKQAQTPESKQSMTMAVQTPVQTAVQTDILGGLTVMERAIVWTLINSEMNLSYEDLATLLGKDKSTIRGQINAIKQKNKGLIEEVRELNGKKRLHIPTKVKENLLKSIKIGVKRGKKEKSES